MMLEDRTVIYTVVLVALVLLATVSYNNMKAKEERQRKGAMPAMPGDPEQDADATRWLSKFAVEGGSVVGETVSIDGSNLILKQAGFYKSIPLSKAKVEGDEVVVSSGINWDDAMEKGAAWHAANTKGQDDAISSQLTRSEDVRAPALKAMAQRDSDSEE